MSRVISISLGVGLLLVSACKDLPVASFIFIEDNAEAWDTVYFQSTCQDATSFDWDFGDGDGSSEENPWHIYIAEGTYTIHLVASNSDGSDEATEDILILPPISKLPLASFTLRDDDAIAWDTVYFQSTCQRADSFEWDFGDGSGSTEESPWHIFESKGTYTIQLAISNQYGSDERIVDIDVLAPKGKVIEVVVHSPGLEGNLLEDSPDREVSIYLPPGYYKFPDKHYPVIYLLHGYDGTNKTWFGSFYMYFSVKPILDALVANNTIEPMIVAAPNSDNKYGGSWYTNSTVSGNWEDFIVMDVVNYMDDHYRTLPKASSRAIAGHSMGGYGTIMLAMKYPDVFGAAYSLSGAWLVFEKIITGVTQESIDNYYNSPVTDIRSIMATVVAWNPNPAIPVYYGEIPFTEDGTIKDSVLQVLMGHDPYTLIDTYKSNLMQLSLLQLDCGLNDGLVTQNRLFSQKLEVSGIDHVYLEHSGDHNSKTEESMREQVFPSFSQHLEHE